MTINREVSVNGVKGVTMKGDMNDASNRTGPWRQMSVFSNDFNQVNIREQNIQTYIKEPLLLFSEDIVNLMDHQQHGRFIWSRIRLLLFLCYASSTQKKRLKVQERPWRFLFFLL